MMTQFDVTQSLASFVALSTVTVMVTQASTEFNFYLTSHIVLANANFTDDILLHHRLGQTQRV